MSKKELCRDKKLGKFGGVCAGVAQYFGIEIWLVRILTVSAVLLTANPFIVFVYIAAWFILDDKKVKSPPVNEKNVMSNQSLKGYVNSEYESVAVKSKVWQAGLPPRQALLDIKQRFDGIELKVQKLEKYVTSNEFQLNRELNNL